MIFTEKNRSLTFGSQPGPAPEPVTPVCDGPVMSLRRKIRLISGHRHGFTLVELVLATAISVLVVGILAVCFSFTLRVWQNAQNQKPDQASLMADLLKRQLAECDPNPIRFSDSTVHPLFTGKSDMLVFVTAHSIKAISQGVPVAARYTYDRNARVLYYSELVLDPYHTKKLERFVAGQSENKENTTASYGVDFPEFALAFAGKEAKQFSETWPAGDNLPVEVLLRWKGNDSVVHAKICILNAPFTIQPAPNVTAPPPGSTGLEPATGEQ